MAQPNVRRPPRASQLAEPLRLGAIAGACAFLAATAAEHLLEPSLAPSRHMVSEYARGSVPAVMIAGFACWSLSLACAAAWVARCRGGRGCLTLAGLLGLCALGIALVAAFRTQTSAGTLRYGSRMSAEGRLHDWGSLLATLSLLAAMVLTSRLRWLRPSLRRRTGWLLALAATCVATLLVVGDPAPGLRQRLLIAVGCGWQIAMLHALRSRARRSGVQNAVAEPKYAAPP